ncbi:DNA-binding transcriptional LysR family regulator [Stackebrandtia endophytica]|uniref:DNA-binding transcriptional LysR family regulator n=1 Tax=Stackebrandtia endophytica TaxID=1496996 RepID=A0A543B475_9ACTN|nr:LysR family transcriptional regulator [Stackebrandtia endophytica]TQL79580.1 DNA-binding transcriptional LysR family regulator [Stackebrandtia endophytica]
MLSLSSLALLHQLRLRGTLTAAAESLRLSRSAASHQLASLQRRLGVPLTERVGRGLRLTEAGEALAIQAERVLAEVERSDAVVERARREVSGTVGLAAVQTAAITVVPRALTLLRSRYPNLRVECRSLNTEEALIALPAGEVDIAVVPRYEATPLRPMEQLVATRLFRDPVRLVVPAGHRLAGSTEPVSITELAADAWVSGEPDSYFGRLVPSLCRRAGFEPDIMHRSADHTVINALVAAGHGVTVLPQSALPTTGSPGPVVLSIADSSVGREVVALTRRGSSHRPTIQAVIDGLRRAGREDGIES